MLKIEGLGKSYGTNSLFEDANFTILENERIGLIGRNGHGKSTLLRILTGEEEPDTGTISIPRGYKIGFLKQHIAFTHATILEEACEYIKSDEGIDLSYKAKEILTGLGFTKDQFDQTPQQLSGGFQIRLNLTKLLVSEPNLLLLDEPTNYLDIISVRWLGRFLKNWPGEVVLITHDRNFMNSVITHTIGIHRQDLRKIEGTTDKFYDLITQEEDIHLRTRSNQLKKREETEKFINRFRAKASKAKAVQSRIKLLEKEELLEELDEISTLDFKFPYQEFKGKWPLHSKNISFRYSQNDHYLIKNLSFSIKTGDKIGIIGKNGKGKTTLLKLLAEELKPTEGAIEFSQNAILGYFGQTNVERLNPEATIEEEIMKDFEGSNRTAIRTICGLMLFSGQLALKKIKVLSGGEKARVLLGKLLAKKTNLLLLDEPTNHLDMQSNEVLLNALKEYNGTILFITHSEELLNEVASKLIIFDRGKVEFFEGNYEDFLTQRGWEEEDGMTKNKNSGNKKTIKLSSEEIKKIKNQLAKERQERLKPLSKEISHIEKSIITLEKEIKEKTEELMNNANAKFAQLSKDIGKAQSSIEILFGNLEKLSNTQKDIEEEFKERIEKLEQAL